MRNTINNVSLIRKEDKWNLVNSKHNPPYILSLIKIHKTELQIRPIINWKNTSA